MEKAKARGSNQHQERSHDATAPRTLADLGISKNQSSSWQQLADICEEDFEAALAGPEPERRACEIRLRAERKAGELLKKMEKAKAGRPKKNRSPKGTDFPKAKTLKDLGISKKQSSSWQQLADICEEDFEAALAGPDKPSTAGIIALAELRLADEIDKGQERGEIAKPHVHVSDVQDVDIRPATLDEIGVDRRRLADWRQLRHASRDRPGGGAASADRGGSNCGFYRKRADE